MTFATDDRSFSPIFIVGYMHSGTTLLLDILKQHPTILTSGGETKFFELLPIIQRTYPILESEQTLHQFALFVTHVIRNGLALSDIGCQKSLEDVGLSQEEVEAILNRARKHPDYGVIFSIVFDHLTAKAHKSRWLEKTPSHIYHIDPILSAIPPAQFVEIVRDPRAVLASKKTRRLTVWTDRYTPEVRPLKHLEKAYDPLWDTLSWKSAIRAGLTAKHAHRGKMITIRYEDLVADPEATMRSLCDFLCLDYEPDMLRVNTKNTAYWEDSNFKGISVESVNRWQKSLLLPEVAIVQLLSRNERQRLGYSSVHIPVASRLAALAYLVRSPFEFLQRLYHRYRMGGWSFLLKVITHYWLRLRKLFGYHL